MASQLSPGIIVQERDVTNSRLQQTITNVAALAGPFSTGEVGVAKLITNEKELVQYFGKPNDNNYEYWFTASEFLNYGGNLRVARISDSSISNLTNANSTGAVASGIANIKINSLVDYETNVESTTPQYLYAAKNPGSWGNSIGVAVIDAGADQIITFASGLTTTAIGTVVSGSSSGAIGKIYSYNSSNNSATVVLTNGTQFTKDDTVQGVSAQNVVAWYDQQYAIGSSIRWNSIAPRPGTSAYVGNRGGVNDELHIVVYDATGKITGAAGSIIEKILYVSKAADAKTTEGVLNYYKTVIKNRSAYVYLGNHESSYAYTPAGAVNLSDTTTSSNIFPLLGNKTYLFAAGTDYSNYNVGNETQTYIDVFGDPDTVPVDYILAGPVTAAKASSLVSLASTRRDCIAFISPRRSDVLGSGASTTSQQRDNVVAFFESISNSSSYAFFDNNYKYIYDRFNDTYRWIPCNADTAGLEVSTSATTAPWYSPAGFNRGNLRSAIKVAFNPTKNQRDDLYSHRVNPIASFPGQGIVLFGDKTALRSPSAFDRINVRRLFLVIEKDIKNFSQNVLFELNDSSTRNNFASQVQAYLADVQSRRGITDFLVVADETNNTPDVIDRNEFVADIYIKPTRSINYITLTFVATRSGVSFAEVVGTV